MRFLKHNTITFSLIAVLLVIIDFGFDQDILWQSIFSYVYISVLVLEIMLIIIRLSVRKYRPHNKVLIFDLILLVFLPPLALNFFNLVSFHLIDADIWIYIAVFLIFFRKLFVLRFSSIGRYVNPAQIFILSFIIIILTGTILLLLPNATITNISPVDALFTSTSAVCVTGLIVVDTGSYFTLFGQIIIIVLVQIGGLGIMTFTSYFSYFFKGSSSYTSQIMLKEIIKTENIADVFKTLKKIILLTGLIEITGAFLVYIFLKGSNMGGTPEKIFFSVFHAISGFCNAGFSTLTNSLYDPAFRFNYPLHLIIAVLFITGGIGFPILFNSYKYIGHFLKNRALPFLRKKQAVHVPWVININTRIVVFTTLILIITGTVFFYLSEYNNTLAEHNGIGKIITAFFGAVTPRTAGFNTVDTAALNTSTILIIIFLMWVGASPGSTGGGIKTSTFAISILNFLSIARGKNRLEIFRREIAESSIRRAYAIITLSILTICVSIFLVSIMEPDMEFLPVAFECFSAFSTVGLSQGVTGDLGSASRIVIIFTMFIGRMSMLTILVAIMKKIRFANYSYPSEDILIN
ncbi:MAG: potassium transporter TrkG [Bacteroidales bacterium]|nr:potassium transporter TrkG [Bacteroidales bacterium]